MKEHFELFKKEIYNKISKKGIDRDKLKENYLKKSKELFNKGLL